jgi:hypothetical protein
LSNKKTSALLSPVSHLTEDFMAPAENILPVQLDGYYLLDVWDLAGSHPKVSEFFFFSPCCLSHA